MDAERPFPQSFLAAKATATVVTADMLALSSPLGKPASSDSRSDYRSNHRSNHQSLAERQSKFPGMEDKGKMLELLSLMSINFRSHRGHAGLFQNNKNVMKYLC